MCLGTDGVSSNNCTDLFSDLKFAAILHNGANCDPLALLPLDALKMATRDGGIALGRQTGVIQGGYDGSDVVMNMARGKVIYKDGEFFTIDLERVRREVADYALPLLFQKN